MQAVKLVLALFELFKRWNSLIRSKLRCLWHLYYSGVKLTRLVFPIERQLVHLMNIGMQLHQVFRFYSIVYTWLGTKSFITTLPEIPLFYLRNEQMFNRISLNKIT